MSVDYHKLLKTLMLEFASNYSRRSICLPRLTVDPDARFRRSRLSQPTIAPLVLRDVVADPA